jgi:SAM-dependent methyltransferase
MTPPTVPCPICDGDLGAGPSLRLSYGSIRSCSGCGSGIFLPRPTSDELSALHSTEEYFDHPYFQDRRELTPRLSESYGRRLARIEGLIGPIQGKRVLDIGCDTGLFLQFLRDRRDITGVGLDVFAKVVAEGRRAGLDLRHATLEQAELEDGGFDVVCGFDLVEHVARPRPFMTEVHRVMKPGGLAVFETPNYNGLVYQFGRGLGRVGFLESPLRRYQERLWPPFHVQYFTADSLRRLMESSGLEPVEVAGRELHGSELALDPGALRAAVVAIFALAGAVGRYTVLTGAARRTATSNRSSSRAVSNHLGATT